MDMLNVNLLTLFATQDALSVALSELPNANLFTLFAAQDALSPALAEILNVSLFALFAAQDVLSPAFTHIDCFGGPGGICMGFRAVGLDTRVAIESIQSCVDTYAVNHPKVHVIHSDIREVTAEQILPFIPAGGVGLVSDGMPRL